MIEPVELKETKPISLPSGEVTTTTDVWNMLKASRDGDLDRIKELVSQCPGLVRCEYNYTLPMHFLFVKGIPR